MTRDSIRARLEAAHEHVHDLCVGRARWTMRVPAEPDRDSDLVITAALADIPALLAVADAAEALLRGDDVLAVAEGRLRAALDAVEGLA